MHVCIWVLMYISDAWIIYMAYIHFACVYSLNLVYSIHNIDYIYIHTFWSEKKSRLSLSQHSFKASEKECFGEMLSWNILAAGILPQNLDNRCLKFIGPAMGEPAMEPIWIAWENAWWIPGEYWWPWIERSEKMWKMGKTDRKMIHKWLVLHIYLQLQEEKHGKTWWDQWCQTHVYHYYIIWL